MRLLLDGLDEALGDGGRKGGLRGVVADGFLAGGEFKGGGLRSGVLFGGGLFRLVVLLELGGVGVLGAWGQAVW